MKTSQENTSWIAAKIKQEQIDKYLDAGQDLIPDAEIEARLLLTASLGTDRKQVRDILAKSLAIETLTPAETAVLLFVKEPELLEEMKRTAALVKKKVYDNRIVTFAPLYLGNYCVNNCAYCGFRRDNEAVSRRVLSQEEVRKEIEVLAGQIGHKRLIAVYGEHPATDIEYIVKSLETIYSVRVPKGRGTSSIRRVNVNAAPFSIEDLRTLKKAGLGTYQVFQETYHKKTYAKLHPAGTLKGNYLWRLYSMHRAQEAGVDDVGLGVLFGLYDWRFEVMALVYHALELEKRFGIGPHTISFPRLEPAANTPFVDRAGYRVSDEDFKKLVTVIRLAVPYTGMILTARESAQMRREVLPYGVTQTDASSRIGIGAYSDRADGDDAYDESGKTAGEGKQVGRRQQFILGDTRSLDEVIRELAEMGYITSFCTAGYRCGRTGDKIMSLLKTGREGKFCKLNAILTFREWLDDFASPPTKAAGEKVIRQEIAEVGQAVPERLPLLNRYYEKIVNGERDLYF